MRSPVLLFAVDQHLIGYMHEEFRGDREVAKDCSSLERVWLWGWSGRTQARGILGLRVLAVQLHNSNVVVEKELATFLEENIGTCESRVVPSMSAHVRPQRMR